MIEHLLVYGTLAPGESNHYMMKDIPEYGRLLILEVKY